MKTWMKVFFTLIGLAAGLVGLVLGGTALTNMLVRAVGVEIAISVVIGGLVVLMAAFVATIVWWAER